MNAEKLTKEIDEQAEAFVKRNFQMPTKEDHILIALAMKVGSTVTLEHMLKDS